MAQPLQPSAPDFAPASWFDRVGGMTQYHFRSATNDDLDLLNAWVKQPHVARWWGADDHYDTDDLADPRVVQWIVSCDGADFAFMQDYTVHGWDDHHFFDLPKGARGIDQMIGPAHMIGQGHGPAFITARCAQLFADGAPVIATDPHPDNTSAITAYAKCGFKPTGTVLDTDWGPCLPMTLNAPD